MRPYILLTLPDPLHAFVGRLKSDAGKEGSMEEVPDMLGYGIHFRDAAGKMVHWTGRATATRRR